MSQAAGRRRSVGASARSWLAARVAAAAIGIACTACAQDGKTIPASTPAARELAASLFEESRWQEAERVTRAIAARADANAQDFVNVACVLVAWQLDPIQTPPTDPDLPDKVTTLCAEARKRDPDLAAAHYVEGVVEYQVSPEQDPRRARPLLERAVALAPEDAFARYHLGSILIDLGEPALAMPHFEKVAELGFEFAGVAFPPSVFKLATLLRQRHQGDDLARAAVFVKVNEQAEKPKSPAYFKSQTCIGRLGRVVSGALLPPAGPQGRALPVAWETASGVLAEAGELRALELGDVDGDRRTDLVAIGPAGIWIARGRADRRWDTARLAPGDFDRLVVAELDLRSENPDQSEYRAHSSVLAFGKSGARLLYAQQPGWFSDDSASVPPLGEVRDVRPVDFDHDGMLDLLVLTADGVKLLRNRGTPLDRVSYVLQGPVAFDDATAAASLEGVKADWVALEDFDHDNDVDLLFGGKDVPTLLFSSLRRGHFEKLGPELTGLVLPLRAKPLLGDFDHDGLADVLTAIDDSALLKGTGANAFRPPRRCAPLPTSVARSNLVDVNLDGQPDAVVELLVRKPDAPDQPPEHQLAFVPGVGAAESDPAVGPPEPIVADAPGIHDPILDDVDLDGAIDVVAKGQVGAWVIHGVRAAAPPRCLLLLRGRKDNRFAIGTLVEVRASARYERRFVERPDQLFAFPPSELAPIVRLTWPNGVVQYPLQSQSKEDVENLLPAKGTPVTPSFPLDPRAEQRLLIEQKKGPPGSCPFLYAWDGARYCFITDVLGATPLGLPIDEKTFVPPAHDEFVRLAPDQVRPVDGEYRFQITEELREVTYLDRAQLWVVDHAADVELHPEERFCFPPFPPKRIHAMEHVVGVMKAVDQSGHDWTAALARIDDTPAIPFKPIGEVFRGIATPSVLELTLPEAARTAKRVRLLMTGWLQWGDASVNLAAAKNGSIDFLPPIFAVPDGRGGWRDCGPPIGFPTGKTKTMVLDVGELLNRADPRLRITTTLELYWDAIRVALDDDASPSNGDATYTVTKLEPKSAVLSFRGFSKPTARRDDQPQLFDWNELEADARWNQHDGMLTRYGDVAPLLDAPDDRFVILSAGDAIDLRFDASAIPPPASGMTRTWLLYLDGWAKDGDPNTVTSQTVEPLPYHAMSGYPYGEVEHYPDDELHARYRREWNTRPGRILIPPLAPLVPTAGAPR